MRRRECSSTSFFPFFFGGFVFGFVILYFFPSLLAEYCKGWWAERKGCGRNKIRNQFRALDEDEIGFLEEVEARKREEAERGRREMEEGLRVFREARRGERKREEDGDGYGYGDDDDGDERGRQVGVGEGEWRVGSKRKRGRRRGEGEGAGGSSSLLLKGVKRTVGGSGGGASGVKTGEDEATGAREKEVVQRNTAETQAEAEATKTVETAPEIAQKPSVAAAAAPKPKLGLVDYGSDDDSE